MMEARSKAEDGFTLLEVSMTMTILVGMILLVSQLLLTSNRAQDLAKRLSMTTEVNRDLLQDIRVEVSTSVQLFENSALGNSYMGMLDFTGEKPAINSTLPTLDAAGNFRKEASARLLTGNTVLFARHDWTDEFICLSGKSYLVEVYRLVRYYLVEEDGGPAAGSLVGLNFCRWAGEPMVDGSQVDRIIDPVDRAEVLEHMRLGTPGVGGAQHPPAELVWRVGEDPAVLDTFKQIEPGGTLSSSPLLPRSPIWTVLRDPVRSSDKLLFYNHFSVATNHASASASLGTFGVLDNSGDGFPHGFEVQVIGPSSGRQVLVHLILVSTRPGLLASSSQKLVVNSRDI